MLIIFLCLLSLNNLSLSPLLENASKFSENIHRECLQALPKSTQNSLAYAALLCGENITDENLKTSLIKSSLIHLFVVSGSHLLLIEEVLMSWGIPFYVRFLFTGLYSFACSWQAPVVRAWIALGTRWGQKFGRLALPADLVVLLAGLICLTLFPEWISSRSLIMSWLASLALSLGALWPLRHPVRRLLLQSTLIYLMMMPALWGFGNLHPLSIVFNIVLAPLVTFALLPIALISCVWNSWTRLFDPIFDLFLWLSHQSTEPVQMAQGQTLSMAFLWSFIFIAHLLIHFLRLHRKRKSV